MDRHLIAKMDEALSRRAARGIPDTNEQALLAYLQCGKVDAYWQDVAANFSYFRTAPIASSSYAASCWITPRGGMFSVPYSGHSQFANDALEYGCPILERGGWLHVSDGKAHFYYDRYTAAQHKTMTKWGIIENDCRAYATARLADDGKDGRMRGLEFRDRADFDWRSDMQRPDLPPVGVAERMFYAAFPDKDGIAF